MKTKFEIISFDYESNLLKDFEDYIDEFLEFEPNNENDARAFAIEAQDLISRTCISWGGIEAISNKMTDIGNRFGLIEEFEENGII